MVTQPQPTAADSDISPNVEAIKDALFCVQKLADFIRTQCPLFILEWSSAGAYRRDPLAALNELAGLIDLVRENLNPEVLAGDYPGTFDCLNESPSPRRMFLRAALRGLVDAYETVYGHYKQWLQQWPQEKQNVIAWVKNGPDPLLPSQLIALDAAVRQMGDALARYPPSPEVPDGQPERTIPTPASSAGSDATSRTPLQGNDNQAGTGQPAEATPPPATSRKRRRRASARKPAPLTRAQTEAMQLVGRTQREHCRSRTSCGKVTHGDGQAVQKGDGQVGKKGGRIHDATPAKGFARPRKCFQG